MMNGIRGVLAPSVMPVRAGAGDGSVPDGSVIGGSVIGGSVLGGSG
jgi:hypothetical protein